MNTLAVVLEAPEQLAVRQLALNPAANDDVVVAIDYSGVSTGTERLLWSGRMPAFPGMGYPLVPGYESVGRIVDAGAGATARIGEHVFVPGANCFTDARGLFGGAAQRLVLPSARAYTIPESLTTDGVLIALAATAHHAIVGGVAPQLIVGHGVLGRLLARLTIALGHAAPTVWETNAARQPGGTGYAVIHPDADDRRDYAAICDVSGDPALLDTLVGCLAKRGEIILAGFYEQRLSFSFPPAFMREARFRIAAEFAPADLIAVTDLIAAGALSLDGLVTHVRAATDALTAYPQAFADADCLKMVLDWRECA